MSGELSEVGTAYQAETFVEQAKADARVEAFEQATAPAAPPAPAKTAEQIEQEQLAKAAEEALPMITVIAWQMLDKGIQSFAGAHCAASQEQLEQLGKLTVPVLNKYLGSLSGFITTPEGLLLAVAAMTYGPPMLMGPPKQAPAPTETPKPEATA